LNRPEPKREASTIDVQWQELVRLESVRRFRSDPIGLDR
jgi:hypothetical protein